MACEEHSVASRGDVDLRFQVYIVNEAALSIAIFALVLLNATSIIFESWASSQSAIGGGTVATFNGDSFKVPIQIG